MSTPVVNLAPTDRLCTVVASSDSALRQRVSRQLALPDYLVEEVAGGAEALAIVEAGTCRTVLLDQVLPDLDVEELVTTIRARHPQVEVLLLDHGISDEAVELTPRSDARDEFSLLPNYDSAPSSLPRNCSGLCAHPVTRDIEPLPGMTGRSQSLQRVYRLARLVAPRNTAVLLTGETGTGKELVARGIHSLSQRRERPFVVINCAAIPEALLEAELFGYNRGAFTGAFQSRLGRLQAANSGTVLLDEVGDLPLSMQAKLLRFLQEGEVQRLGSSESTRVDVRVIAATNADLCRLVKEQRFRADLYYRLAVFPIAIDPLRQRRDDVAPLSRLFLEGFSQEARVPAKSLPHAALETLENYSWPGNVRELRQVVERAFILAEEAPELRPEHLLLGQSDL